MAFNKSLITHALLNLKRRYETDLELLAKLSLELDDPIYAERITYLIERIEEINQEIKNVRAVQ